MDAARQELEQIPPPSKNRYLSVRTKELYANPFLVVHPQTVTLIIIYRDQDPDSFNAGGVLRPAKARKQEVDVRLDDLPQALSALSPDAWPYGRVVAIEESPTAPRAERVAIRRNVEATIQILNDLGVVVDEWTGSNGALALCAPQPISTCNGPAASPPPLRHPHKRQPVHSLTRHAFPYPFRSPGRFLLLLPAGHRGRFVGGPLEAIGTLQSR
jgi:hypothetical protein